jgi:DNA-binding transcriptional MerR regulator
MVHMKTPALWTLDELAAKVAAALASAADAGEYPGAPNGRVRDVPDRRAIRWYATVGLLDRPAGARGRTALYGRRHLLQLVAIKRRQAQGRSLADIQAELLGATDETLSRVARLPDEVPDPPTPLEPPTRSPHRTRFWAEPPPEPPPKPPSVRPPVLLLSGVPLHGGAVLLLPAAPDPDDVPAIAAAARPLLELLAARGLITEGTADDHRPH